MCLPQCAVLKDRAIRESYTYINIFITFHSKKRKKADDLTGRGGREVRKEEQQLIIIGLLPFLWHDGRIATEPKNVCAIFSIWSPESTDNILSPRWQSKSRHPSSRLDALTTELLDPYDEQGQIYWCPFNFLIHFICFCLVLKHCTVVVLKEILPFIKILSDYNQWSVTWINLD